jgi:hypothetical protein
MKKLALFFGSDDALVDPKDRAKMLEIFESSGISERVAFKRIYDGFAHRSWFVGGKDAWYWMDDLVEVLPKINGKINYEGRKDGQINNRGRNQRESDGIMINRAVPTSHVIPNGEESDPSIVYV